MKSIIAAAVAAATAVAVASPAKADTIVQYDSLAWERGFHAFDPDFGTLTAVQLEIDVDSPRSVTVALPDSSRTSLDVAWQIDGGYSFRVISPYLGALVTGVSPIGGTGTAHVLLSDDGFGRAVGTFRTRAKGVQGFDLDPALFVATDPFGSIGNLRLVFGSDHGFYGSNDTLLSNIPVGAEITGQGGCGPYSGQDFCVNAAYKLTYSFNPLAAAVPEPATWAMMIVGLGAIGGVMRRRRIRVPVAC